MTQTQIVESNPFESIAPRGEGAQGAALMTRQAAEVQAAMVIAKKFPRDQARAYTRIMDACKRPSLAEAAEYQYSRGGTPVIGPSIRLAEAMAQAWGNIDFGITELEQKDGESHMLAYAWDLETNSRQHRAFVVKHVREKGSGQRKVFTQLDSARDIYEMSANQGARRLRACILGIIPGDVVDGAVQKCRETLNAKHKDIPLEDRIRKMLAAFEPMGVSQAMIEQKLGHKVDVSTLPEVLKMVRIYTSIKDEMSSVEDNFQKAAPESKDGEPGGIGNIKPNAGEQEPPKQKRKRRTKAEMEAARAKEAEEKAAKEAAEKAKQEATEKGSESTGNPDEAAPDRYADSSRDELIEAVADRLQTNDIAEMRLIRWMKEEKYTPETSLSLADVDNPSLRGVLKIWDANLERIRKA